MSTSPNSSDVIGGSLPSRVTGAGALGRPTQVGRSAVTAWFRLTGVTVVSPAQMAERRSQPGAAPGAAALDRPLGTPRISAASATG